MLARSAWILRLFFLNLVGELVEDLFSDVDFLLSYAIETMVDFLLALPASRCGDLPDLRGDSSSFDTPNKYILTNDLRLLSRLVLTGDASWLR